MLYGKKFVTTSNGNLFQQYNTWIQKKVDVYNWKNLFLKIKIF